MIGPLPYLVAGVSIYAQLNDFIYLVLDERTSGVADACANYAPEYVSYLACAMPKAMEG